MNARKAASMLVSLLFTALLSIGGIACATAHAPSSGGGGGASDAHPATAAELLSRQVNESHDAALFAADSPFLFNEESIREFARDFIAQACPTEAASGQASVSAECNRKFGSAIATVLHRRYFAADTDVVQAHCRAEPLTCEDARTFEVLFRQEHNDGIERSRNDKLHKINDWRLGRIDEAQLQHELHFRFDVSNGTLTTHVPGAAASERAPAGGG